MLLYHAARHDAMRHDAMRHNTKKCMALVYAYNVSRIKNSGMVYDSKSSIIVLLSLDKKTERKRCNKGSLIKLLREFPSMRGKENSVTNDDCIEIMPGKFV